MRAFAPVRTVAPVTAILSLADAKAHLHLEGSDEDAYIEGLVAAATSHLDGYAGILGQALITQTWRQRFDQFPKSDAIRLPVGPLLAVSSISYFDTAGAAQSFTDYLTTSDEVGPMVVLKDDARWPSTATRPDAVTVTWTAGFGAAASDVPQAIPLAAKMLVAHWHANREAVNIGNISSELPLTVAALLSPFRKVGF